MVDNSTDTTTTVAQFTNTAQQQKQDTTTMSTMTEDQGFQNNSPVTTETTPAEVATADPPPTTTATSIAEATTNSPTVPKETAIATTTASEAPLPEPTATTTQAVITTTVEETPVQTHQPPTEVFTTKVDSTMPIATPYVESIYSTPTMIAPGVVSSFSTTSTGFPISNPVNTMAVPSTTTAATTISCISSNQTSHCTTTDLSTNTMSTGQIAGIAVGAIAFVSLLGACLFIVIRKKRNNTDHYRNQSNKQVSPVADDHEKQSNSSLNNSHAVLYQGLSPESSQICSNPEMSESVYGDNLFYSNSADYRRTSSIMNVNNNNGYLPNSKDSQLGTPTSLYPHTARRRYDSYSSSSESTIVMNSKASPYYATTASAQLHQKSPMNQQQQQQQQDQLPYIQSARSSGEIDTDNYTLSAMQLFRDSRQTTTTIGTRSTISSSIMSDNRKIYRPSLNHSSAFHHSPSSSMDSTTGHHPTVSGRPPSSLRFSHHQRQESSLDPHILPSTMQKKMSLWDDHL